MFKKSIAALIVIAIFAVVVSALSSNFKYADECKHMSGRQLQGPYHRNLCVVEGKIVNMDHL